MADVRRWSEYVIAVYGPNGRVVEVHDCRETVTAQGKPACRDGSNRCAVWDNERSLGGGRSTAEAESPITPLSTNGAHMHTRTSPRRPSAPHAGGAR